MTHSEHWQTRAAESDCSLKGAEDDEPMQIDVPGPSRGTAVGRGDVCVSPSPDLDADPLSPTIRIRDELLRAHPPGQAAEVSEDDAPVQEGPAPSRSPQPVHGFTQERAEVIRAAAVEEQAALEYGSLTEGEDDGTDGSADPLPSLVGIWNAARAKSKVYRIIQGELADPCRAKRESRQAVSDYRDGPDWKHRPAGRGKRGGWRPAQWWDETKTFPGAPLCRSPGCLYVANPMTASHGGYCCVSRYSVHNGDIPSNAKPHSKARKYILAPITAFDEEYRKELKKQADPKSIFPGVDCSFWGYPPPGTQSAQPTELSDLHKRAVEKAKEFEEKAKAEDKRRFPLVDVPLRDRPYIGKGDSSSASGQAAGATPARKEMGQAKTRQHQDWWDSWEREQDRTRGAGRAKPGPGSDDVFRELYNKPVQDPWRIVKRARRDVQHSVIYYSEPPPRPFFPKAFWHMLSEPRYSEL